MALTIRLRRQGRTNRPFYRVVLTDSRNPREGRYVETLGWYNPVETEQEKTLSLKEDRILHWVDLGATVSEKALYLVARGAPAAYQRKKEKEEAARAKKRAKQKARRKAAA